MTLDPTLVAAVEAAVQQRGTGRLMNGELKFTCPEPSHHANGDAHASARYHVAKKTWFCDVGGIGGGVRDLGRRLGLATQNGTRPQRETARWTIRDVTGAYVAEHVRVEPGRGGKPKDCLWFVHDTAGLSGRKVTDLPLYGVDELVRAPAGSIVVVTEGEKACDALRSRGVLAVGTVTGAGGTPADAVLVALCGFDVALWPDADAPGRQHMRRIAQRLTALGIPCRVVGPWPDAIDGTDAADFTGTDEGLRALLSTATAPAEDDTCGTNGPRHDSGDSDVGADGWPEPDRSILDAYALPPPPLPLEVFAPPWRRWIVAAAAAKSCPVDYVAVGLLSGASILLGNARWGAPWPGWSEPPVIWSAAVGTPSSGKSPGLDAPRTEVEGLERDANAGRPERVRRYEADVTIAGLRRKVWESACTQALRHGEQPPAQPDDATPPDRPRYTRLVTNDPTIEKVARLVLENPKGVMVFRDELAGWLGNMDRYGGAGSDRAFYLESYGGRRFAVDRVKDPEPLVVPALTLVICGGIQPDRLQSLLLTGDDDGLVARFLWTWPERVPPRRPDRTVPDGASAALTRLMTLAIPDGKEHGVIPFTDAAAATIQAYRTETATLEVDATGLYLSWLGKLPGMAVRLAAVLEHLGWCGSFGDFADSDTGVYSSIDPPAVVSERSAVAAMGFLEDYAIPMARRCFGEASWPQVDRDARTFGRWLLAQHPVPDQVNLRDVQRHHAPLGRDAARYAAAAGELVLAGWLREAAVTPARGRRAKTLLVNPRLRAAV